MESPRISMKLIGIFLVIWMLHLPAGSSLYPYSFMCNVGEVIGGHEIESRCDKVENLAAQNQNKDTPGQNLNACKMTCGPYGALWPRPTGNVNLSQTLFDVLPSNIGLELAGSTETSQGGPIQDMFHQLKEIFRQYTYKMHPQYRSDLPEGNPFRPNKPIQSSDAQVRVVVEIEQKNIIAPKMDANESYSLVISPDGKDEENRYIVNIRATTYFGARHGIETLSQLISYKEKTDSLQMHTFAQIDDAPIYPHRGVLIDTSRNYFSVDILKRIVDGLSYNKMNVFHWHITDSHSFPMEVQSIPELVEWGAYSKHKTYSQEDIKDMVAYARIRGVKVLPEFDAPAHVGNGWQFAEQKFPEWGRLAVCVNQEPWQEYCVEPPCGQFNILNDKVYDLLGQLYTEMFAMFDTDVFHMGGDEVNFNCWNTTKEFQEYMKENEKNGTKKDFLDLWRIFQRKAYNLVVDANNGTRVPAIIWTNSMTEDGVEKYLLKTDYIIQLWAKSDDDTILDIINKGYRTIFSPYDKYYLDCGYSSWVGEGNNWCSPYKGWQLIYDNSPRGTYRGFEGSEEKYEENILGGEAAMWSEQVQGVAVEGKLWPRVAALGERLWADPGTGWKQAESRMVHMRERLVSRGISADALQPEWCHQNEALCYVKN